MKNSIKKIGFLLLALTFTLNSCEDDEVLTITSPDPSFTLQAPGISSIFLNHSFPNNAALEIVWEDQITDASSYTVEMDLEETFTNPVTLGTTQGKTFTSTVQELNNAINNAGATNFRDVAVYVRINAGTVSSNSVLFLVTTYPNNPATVSSPSNGDSFVLDIASLDLTAMTITWEDLVLDDTALGLEVQYSIEAALAGTNFASVSPVTSVTNVKTIDITHEALNNVALGLGLTPDVAGNVDMRIIARSTNQNGDTLMRTSDTFTVSVTPFNSSFPYLYFVGNAFTSDWNNNNNNQPLFRSQDTPNSYNFTGYFGASGTEFKVLEILGQWQPQWGTNDGTTLAVNPGGGSDPGSFSVPSAGYYKATFSPMVEGGSYTIESYDASSAPTYTSMAIIGNATPNGWDDSNDTNFTQDPNNPHLWYMNGVTLTAGEFLIRADDMWNDVWRYTGSTNLFGQAVLAGGGDNFPFTEATGTYDFWFNDLDGSYVIIPN